MKSLLQLAATLTLLTLGVCVAVLTRDAHRLAADSSALIGHGQRSLAELDVTLVELDRTAESAQGVLGEVQATAQNLKLSSAAETAYWNATAKQTALAARDLRQLIARTDRELNDKFLPDLDTQVSQTSGAAQLSLKALTHSADTLTFQLQDPEISQMAEHLNLAAGSIADAAASTASATKHLDASTADVEQAVHRLTRPPSMLKQIGMGILDVGAKLGSIAAGFVR